MEESMLCSGIIGANDNVSEILKYELKIIKLCY